MKPDPGPLGARIFVYIGPTVPGLSTRTILGRQLPDHVKAMVEECGALNRLIVPLNLMTATIRAGRRRGSKAYQDMQDIINHYRR